MVHKILIIAFGMVIIGSMGVSYYGIETDLKAMMIRII